MVTRRAWQERIETAWRRRSILWLRGVSRAGIDDDRAVTRRRGLLLLRTAPRGRRPVAIECKWSVRDFDPASLLVFSRAYPRADLIVTSQDAQPALHETLRALDPLHDPRPARRRAGRPVAAGEGAMRDPRGCHNRSCGLVLFLGLAAPVSCRGL